MESSFSFRFIKLGAALVLLLLSAIMPDIGKYILMAIGGVCLMTAFASLGNYDYNGIPSKTLTKVIRWAIAVLLVVVSGIQIYVQTT